MNCPKCDKEIKDDALFCPYCGFQVAVKEEEIAENQEITQENEKVAEAVLNSTEEKPKKFIDKKKMIILGVVAVIAIVGIIFGVKSYMDGKAREEYIAQYNQYVDDIGTLKLEMLHGGANAEKVCNLTLKVWSNAIWKKSSTETDKYTKPNGTFVSDFNDALLNITKDKTAMDDRVDLKGRIHNVTESMEKMKNPPEDLKDKYETLKEMFSSYEDFLNAAITPSGSYTSYNASVNKLDTDFMKFYKKVDAFDLTHISE